MISIGYCKFAIEGSTEFLIAPVVAHEGARWIALQLLRNPTTGPQEPGVIVPMEKLFATEWPDDQGYWVCRIPVPRLLAYGPTPPELLHEYGAVTAPGLADMQGPQQHH
jgi:hypothetical protein